MLVLRQKGDSRRQKNPDWQYPGGILPPPLAPGQKEDGRVATSRTEWYTVIARRQAIILKRAAIESELRAEMKTLWATGGGAFDELAEQELQRTLPEVWKQYGAGDDAVVAIQFPKIVARMFHRNDNIWALPRPAGYRGEERKATTIGASQAGRSTD